MSKNCRELQEGNSIADSRPSGIEICIPRLRRGAKSYQAKEYGSGKVVCRKTEGTSLKQIPGKFSGTLANPAGQENGRKTERQKKDESQQDDRIPYINVTFE